MKFENEALFNKSKFSKQLKGFSSTNGCINAKSIYFQFILYTIFFAMQYKLIYLFLNFKVNKIVKNSNTERSLCRHEKKQ